MPWEGPASASIQNFDIAGECGVFVEGLSGYIDAQMAELRLAPKPKPFICQAGAVFGLLGRRGDLFAFEYDEDPPDRVQAGKGLRAVARSGRTAAQAGAVAHQTSAYSVRW